MRVGDILGDRFELVHLAGSGGMGVVYKAIDRQTGQPVAVKALISPRGNSAARFAREARVLADLVHPRIVRYVAHGALASGEPYLVMEWLAGQDLSARLTRGRLGGAESVELAIRMAEALGFAHARGVVHRDLKPSNIFLQGGRLEAATLLDFGIAQLGVASRMTQTGVLLGTPGYMAPEQAGGGERHSAEADVFALGCVLFECLTGEPAFAGDNLLAILGKILFDAPPPLREKLPTAPQALEALLERMLAKKPEERLRDGHALADALRALGEIPAMILNEAPRVSSRASALTGGEQRAVALILIRAPKLDTALVEALRHGETMDRQAQGSLEREASIHGGHFERLFDGSAAVMLTSTSVPTDLAAQAARCALAMRALAAGRPIALTMGRGRTTGPMPMGHAIDRAAQLVGAAPRDASAPDGMPIIIDGVAAGLLDPRFDVRESEAGFALYGERELAEGTRTLLGKATPCVGRDRELRALDQAFDDCLAERAAQAVLVTAPAGAGKSRVAQEFLRRLNSRREQGAIWIARGDSLRAGSAFGLLGQALRRACAIRDGEPLSVRQDKLRARVSEHVTESERGRVTEFLGEIIGAPFPDEDSVPLHAARRDAQLMTDQMRTAFLDFLAVESAASPVVIVFEDLHWGDRPTVQFIDRALKDLRDHPLFVLALARPEVDGLFPKLWAERGVQELSLRELNPKAIERLARHVLGQDVDRETIERLTKLSEGNAFYLEELIRRAAEGRGAELPETVVAMVQSRLGTLDDDARRVLRAASIFGEVFWAGGVASLLGGAARTGEVQERLRELIAQEVLVKRGESRFPGEEEITFRHALLREGAYSMLTDEDRALGHGLAGAWLEQRGEQDMSMLADHFEKGGDSERSGRCYLRAAEQAILGGDVAAGTAHARRGLACPLPHALRTRLLGTLCEAAFWNREAWNAVLPDAEEVVRIAEPGSVPWVMGLITKLNCAVQAGRLDDFMAMLGVLRETDHTEDAAAPMVGLLGSSAHLLDIAGRIKDAGALVERQAALVQSTGDSDPQVRLMRHLNSGVRNSFANRDPWSALKHSEAAVTLAARLGHRGFLGVAQTVVGMTHWFLGYATEAERALRAIALLDEELSHSAFVRPFCLAWLLAEHGAFDEARALATEIIMSKRAQHVPMVEGRGRWALAEVRRREGELDAAEGGIKPALEILSKAAPLDHPAVLATLAALRLAQGRPAEALAAADEGMVRAGSVGACSYFFRSAFLHLTHAECLEATGNDAAARAAIAEARRWIFAVADKIGDPAYRRSFLEDVPENRKTLELARQWLGESV